jgi:hypothetical protein
LGAFLLFFLNLYIIFDTWGPTKRSFFKTPNKSSFQNKAKTNCQILPPSLKLISKFSDRFWWFEFDWCVLWAEFDTLFYLVNSKIQRKISDFKNVFRWVWAV